MIPRCCLLAESCPREITCKLADYSANDVTRKFIAIESTEGKPYFYAQRVTDAQKCKKKKKIDNKTTIVRPRSQHNCNQAKKLLPLDF